MNALILALALLTPMQAQGKKKKAAAPPGPPTLENINPRDRMEGAIGDKRAGYYLWLDKDEWHLRTGSQNRKATFTGTIKLKGGTFKAWHEVGMEKKGKNPDWFRINDARNQMTWQITTAGGADGINFKVEAGSDAELEFDLIVGGAKGPQRVAIGKNGRHPSQVPFLLKAIPPERKEEEKPKKGKEKDK
ncbi:MAG TPA: hypothetical protein VNC50_13800 [Planctomycetia bacterium]|nr:hypothetical protein [Planctomycetia bacterium]